MRFAPRPQRKAPAVRLRPLCTAVIATLVLAAPLTAPAGAAPERDRPPRTAGQTSDPRGDASGPTARRAFADLTRVRYGMPLRRNDRMLDVEVDLTRISFPPFPDEGEPEPERDQTIRTVVDGPGSLTYVVVFTNDVDSPRVVRLLPSGERRQVRWTSATTAIGSQGGRGEMSLSISTEWLRGDRATFRTRALSGRAVDRTARVGRLNTRQAGSAGRGGSFRPAGGPDCSTADGVTTCEWHR